MAQPSVYSLNVVGYVTVQVPANPGFALLANPFDDGAGNFLTNVIAGDPPNYDTVPDGTTLFPWNNAGGSYGESQSFLGGLGWIDPNVPAPTNTIPPGAGFWIQSGGAAFTVTFVGNVQQGSPSANLGTGFTLVGSPIPLGVPVGSKGDINTAGPNDPTAPTLQMPAFDNDSIYLYNNGVGYGDTPTYLFGVGWLAANSGTSGPTNIIGDGFWVGRAQEDQNAAGAPATSTSNGVQAWTTTFTVQ